MAEEKKVSLSCDDVIFLISRNIDGDLNRSETIQLHEHIATCAQCRIHMSQLSALGNSMDGLRKHYQVYSPCSQFKQSIHDAVSKKKKYGNPRDQANSLLQKLRRRNFFSIIFKPAFGIMGAVAVLSLSMLFWWQGEFQQAPSPERFIVHQIPLRSAEDTVNWNQQLRIPPSQTIHLNVLEAHPDPYFFRVSSSNSVGYSITHNKKIKESKDVQIYQLNGIQYITLKNPQTQDIVHIHNRGTRPISLKTFSHRPQAIQASFK